MNIIHHKVITLKRRSEYKSILSLLDKTDNRWRGNNAPSLRINDYFYIDSILNPFCLIFRNGKITFADYNSITIKPEFEVFQFLSYREATDYLKANTPSLSDWLKTRIVRIDGIDSLKHIYDIAEGNDLIKVPFQDVKKSYFDTKKDYSSKLYFNIEKNSLVKKERMGSRCETYTEFCKEIDETPPYYSDSRGTFRL